MYKFFTKSFYSQGKPISKMGALPDCKVMIKTKNGITKKLSEEDRINAVAFLQQTKEDMSKHIDHLIKRLSK